MLNLDFEKITQELKSKFSDERNVLGLELLLTVVSITSIAFLAFTAGEELSKFLVFPVAVILFVPFLSTLAYYRGFRKTALSTILLVILIPVTSIAWFVITQLPSAEAGLLVVFMAVYIAVATAVLPYLIFAAALTVHYYKETFQEEK